MSRRVSNQLKRVLAVVLLLAVVLPSLMQVQAHGAAAKLGESRVVRVGFPIQPELTDKDEQGNYIGYTVDYLNELAKYTNWTFEYVEVEGDLNTQILTLCDMLSNGEIDMLGAMNRSEQLEDMYLYPSYSYGTAYTVLAVDRTYVKYMEDDPSHWDGIRIAVCSRLEHRVKQLEQYAKINGFSYTLVEYPSQQEMIQAVLDGEADATLQVDISMEQNLRSIARFSPNPYYFAVAPGEQRLLRELNSALDNLSKGYPYLQSELYEKYFTKHGQFGISQDMREHIASLGVQRVLFFQGNSPIQDGNLATGQVYGVAKSYLDQFSELTGFQYEPVIAQNYRHGVELIESGQVDLVAAVPANADLAVECGLLMTQPYFESRLVLVSAPSSEEGAGGEPNWMMANALAEMERLNSTQDESTYLDGFSVNFYTQKQGRFPNLELDWTSADSVRYSVGVPGQSDERLVQILNSYANSITEEALQDMLYHNSAQVVHYTVWEYIQMHLWKIVAFAAVLFVAAALCIIRNVRQKNRVLSKMNNFNERFRRFSGLLNECIFDYDYQKDYLQIENNQYLFVGRHDIQNFTVRPDETVLNTPAVRTLYQTVLEMIQARKDGVVDLSLDFEGTGEYRWYRLVLRYMEGDGPDEGFAMGRFLDVHEEIERSNELKKQASNDALTGLLNRSTIQRQVSRYMEEGNRAGVMLLFDVDNFKRVNDTMGHPEGDALLKQIANCLDNTFRATDMKGRMGGDEFIVFLPGNIPHDLLRSKLQTMIDYLNNLVFTPYKELHVSLSIGAAYIQGEIEDFDGLYKHADYAMYVAKLGGKNGFFITDSNTCTNQTCEHCMKSCKRAQYLESKKRSQEAAARGELPARH